MSDFLCVVICSLLITIVVLPETVGIWQAHVDNVYDKHRVYSVEVE